MARRMRWGFVPLTPRDAHANNLAGALNFAHRTLAAPKISAPRLVVGWSWQIPLGGDGADYPTRHRIVPAVDLLPRSDGATWRGRLGYRYARRHLFAGAGVGIDRAGVNLSPEVGVKFLHLEAPGDPDMDLSMHLLARAEIAADTGHLRGGTILLGWNLF